VLVPIRQPSHRVEVRAMNPFRPLVACAFLAAVIATPQAGVAGEECDPFLSLGDAQFLPVGSGPTHTLVGDFNEDGKPDLAVANSEGSSSLMILHGDGLGGYTQVATHLVTGQPLFLAAGDFNNDGIVDLALTRRTDSSVALFLGQGVGGVGDGSFAAPVTSSAGGFPFQIVAGDYDEDGNLDVAVAINSASRVAVMRGLGNGSFNPPVNYPLSNLGRGISQGDFNSDGILDLVATEWMAHTVGVLLGQGSGGVGNGTFGPTAHYPAGAEPVDIDVFDYDKDSILDLAVANGASGGTVILRGQGVGGIGNGAFAVRTTIPTGNTSCVLGMDIDQDGLIDILSGEYAVPVGRRLHIALGTGTDPVGDGAWASRRALVIDDEPYQIVAADLNGDLREDVAISPYTNDRLTFLFGDCRQGTPLPPDVNNPVLTRVRDVPEDEGGRVYVTWLPSGLDISGGAVTSYRLWREIPEEEALQPVLDATLRTTRTETGPGGLTLVTFWEAVATLPAQRLAGYGYTAATTEDSTASNPHSTAFFVSALTSNIDVFYNSDIVRGASIDNLAPAAPANVYAAAAPLGMFALAWAESPEPDLGHYRVDRSSSPDFSAEATTSIVTTATEHSETFTGGALYFRVVAVDEHENASPPSATIATGTVDVGGAPRVLALAGARPNPATAGDATLLFSLASDAPATLEVFDVRGRRVAAPSLAGLGAGDHALRLDREVSLAPGVYVVRLVQGAARLERKIAIAR
jgi:hypothetical protein